MINQMHLNWFATKNTNNEFRKRVRNWTLKTKKKKKKKKLPFLTYLKAFQSDILSHTTIVNDLYHAHDWWNKAKHPNFRRQFVFEHLVLMKKQQKNENERIEKLAKVNKQIDTKQSEHIQQKQSMQQS